MSIIWLSHVLKDSTPLYGGVTRRNKFRYYYTEFLKKSLDDVEMERLCRTFSSLVVDEVVSSPEIPGAEAFYANGTEK